MEPGCILPDHRIQELKKEGNIVLTSLARLCECSKEDLLRVLMDRNTPQIVDQPQEGVFGYKKYKKQENNKVRTLREPKPQLKKIQETIRKYLLRIPVSLASTAGEGGDSADKNAELHRYNPYLITLDIKNAYPSIDTARVHKNLKTSLLGKGYVDTRAPLIENKEHQELFIAALTHLCVSENELPQGAPTSNQIQNIVMLSVDKAIEKRLPELHASDAIYSRYADDMAISFPCFRTMTVLEEQFRNYLKIFHHGTKDQCQQAIENFSQEKFILTDNYEHKYLTASIKKIRKLISDSPHFTEDEKYQHIGIIDTYKKRIERSGRRIEEIEKEILQIIWKGGRTVNKLKTKIRTPQSNTEREVNKICFDENGNRSLNKKKQGQYKRLFRELTEYTIEELINNKHYDKKFQLQKVLDTGNHSSIIATLRGVYNRIETVYGKDRVPKELKELYCSALLKRGDYSARKVDPTRLEKRLQKLLAAAEKTDFLHRDREEYYKTMTEDMLDEEEMRAAFWDNRRDILKTKHTPDDDELPF